jgi:3-oxoacyl-(acyl-carrier-protein) synthase
MSHPTHDAIEARALARVFGEKGVPVGAMASLVGTSAALGSVAATAGLMGMQCGFLPAGTNYEVPDPECAVDLVAGAPRRQHYDTFLVNSASLGGSNASVVFRRYAG